jgi:hypothetical protein
MAIQFTIMTHQMNPLQLVTVEKLFSHFYFVKSSNLTNQKQPSLEVAMWIFCQSKIQMWADRVQFLIALWISSYLTTSFQVKVKKNQSLKMFYRGILHRLVMSHGAISLFARLFLPGWVGSSVILVVPFPPPALSNIHTLVALPFTSHSPGLLTFACCLFYT